jgi:hypothetical protein
MKSDRSIKRGRAFKVGKFFNVANATYYPCVIRDLTSKGAMIETPKSDLIGSTVEMIIKPEDVKVLGRVAWRDGDKLGVQFDRSLNWLERHDVMDIRRA